MEAYRDQYATIFNNGRNVVLIAISADADTTLAAWAREQDFPMVFASDTDGQIGTVYGAFDPRRNMDDRSLFVVGADGRITYAARPFRALSGPDYENLGRELDRLAPPVPPDSSS